MPDPSPQAFSPGSVTLFFSPVLGATPRESYSRGCAVNVCRGVAASVAPAAEIRVLLNGVETLMPPVLHVLATLAPQPVRVAFETPLPLGAGFGVSAACCVSAALAIDRRFGLGLGRARLGMVAHEAEVRSRTGLGDVSAQLCGGVVFRTCQRGPLEAHRLSAGAGSLFYRVFGTLKTAGVLGDAARLRAVQGAGDDAVAWLSGHEDASMSELLDRALGFATASGLLSDAQVRSAVERARSAGGHATMIMLGQSVLSTVRDEGDGAWVECGIDLEGARCL